jgi:hypothetical protein
VYLLAVETFPLEVIRECYPYHTPQGRFRGLPNGSGTFCARIVLHICLRLPKAAVLVSNGCYYNNYCQLGCTPEGVYCTLSIATLLLPPTAMTYDNSAAQHLPAEMATALHSSSTVRAK